MGVPGAQECPRPHHPRLIRLICGALAADKSDEYRVLAGSARSGRSCDRLDVPARGEWATIGTLRAIGRSRARTSRTFLVDVGEQDPPTRVRPGGVAVRPTAQAAPKRGAVAGVPAAVPPAAVASPSTVMLCEIQPSPWRAPMPTVLATTH